MNRTLQRTLRCMLILAGFFLLALPVGVEARNVSFQQAYSEYAEGFDDRFSQWALDAVDQVLSAEERAYRSGAISHRGGVLPVIAPWTQRTVKFVNNALLINDIIRNADYESPQEHALFRLGDNGYHAFDVVVNILSNFNTPDKLVLYLEDKIVGEGYTFIDTPEVSSVLNDLDGPFIQLLDAGAVTAEQLPAIMRYTIHSFFGLITSESTMEEADLILQAYRDQFRNRCPFWLNVYKPNIYLYGPEGTRIGVSFRQEGLLTRTIPEYSDVWEVKILSDGRLLVEVPDTRTETAGAGVPSVCDYLFYESCVCADQMQMETGFPLKAASPAARAVCFRELLQQYGFNDTEINDFTEYWVARLDADKDYVMYPQNTGIVERVMPLEITGQKPDACTRIWFFFCEDRGQTYAPAEIERIRRGNVTLVEWGGVLE